MMITKKSICKMAVLLVLCGAQAITVHGTDVSKNISGADGMTSSLSSIELDYPNTGGSEGGAGTGTTITENVNVFGSDGTSSSQVGNPDDGFHVPRSSQSFQSEVGNTAVVSNALTTITSSASLESSLCVQSLIDVAAHPTHLLPTFVALAVGMQMYISAGFNDFGRWLTPPAACVGLFALEGVNMLLYGGPAAAGINYFLRRTIYLVFGAWSVNSIYNSIYPREINKKETDHKEGKSNQSSMCNQYTWWGLFCKSIGF